MVKDLVSVITPCYNGEKTIARLMDSILDQTYKNIEFILVNDGSVDKTEEIARSYEQKFIGQGMTFKYVYQENKGLGGAINTGLKHFTGEFLCWPDADDYLEVTSVEERVNFLKGNPEYAVVTSNAYIRNEDDLNNPRLMIDKVTENTRQKNQFKLMLNGYSVFCSGCHMVRTEAFLQVNPEREIYQARRGQNWQLLLPLYHKFNRYFLDKPLYNYVIYQNSMSRSDNNMEDKLLRYDEHQDILIHTLSMIENVQKTSLQKEKDFVKKECAYNKMHVALVYNEYKAFDREFKVKKEYGIEKRDIIYLMRRYIKPINKLYFKIKNV